MLKLKLAISAILYLPILVSNISFAQDAADQEQHVGVESQKTPVIYTPYIEPQDVKMPYVAPHEVITPPISVQKICTPANILCVGPFDLPPMYIIRTREVGEESEPPIAYTPEVTSIEIGEQETPVIKVGLNSQGVDFFVSPEVSFSERNIGPYNLLIPTPAGNIPVSVCGDGCPGVVLVPSVTGVASPQGGFLKIIIQVGSLPQEITIPFSPPSDQDIRDIRDFIPKP